MHCLQTIIQRNHPDGKIPNYVEEQQRKNARFVAKDLSKVTRCPDRNDVATISADDDKELSLS